jgi:hypothetical protein
VPTGARMDATHQSVHPHRFPRLGMRASAGGSGRSAGRAGWGRGSMSSAGVDIVT